MLNLRLYRALSVWAILIASPALASNGQAETRIIYKSSLEGTAYYQMGLALADAVQTDIQSGLILTLEESHGSMQNVMEVMARQGDYVFTAPPMLIEQAVAGEGPFETHRHPGFQGIRGLFPMPPITMHFVVAGDEGVVGLDQLIGTRLLAGRATFGAHEAERYLELFDLNDDVRLVSAALDNGAQALEAGQIDAFVTASSFPAPNVFDVAAQMPISLVSFSDEQIAQTGAVAQTIPGGTYPGVEADVHTTSLPVMAFTTTLMSDDTAYRLTRAFWEHLNAMADDAPWWQSVTPELLEAMSTPLHAGALRYYDQVGIEVPEALRSP